MKNTYLFIAAVVPVLLLSGRAVSGYATEYASSIPDEHTWTLEYSDPTGLAAEVIVSSSSLWSPLGYRVMHAKYTLGRFGAQHGVGYVLLASPRLTVSMVTGGFYGVGSTVGRDILLSVIERSVGSPDLLCRDISNAMISEGLEEYAQAYEIAREFIQEGSLSREDAIDFLDKRWGIYKLVIAEGLYNDTVSRSYSISSQIRDAVIEEITVELERALGSGSSIPVAEYAHFVRDLMSILENRNIGLMDYRPYLDFESRMEGINALRLDESERFSAEAPNWDPSAVIDFNGMQWLVGPDMDMDWYEARDWVASLGCGWRMPSLDELTGLVSSGIRCFSWGPFENSGYMVWASQCRNYLNFGSGWEGSSIPSNPEDYDDLAAFYESGYVETSDGLRAFAVRAAHTGQRFHLADPNIPAFSPEL